ncbi:hypothetical protein H0K60_004492 [Salmonella enterica]|nr:hypothetical protein [Salmonella enterica]EFR2649734.1 hypothetical protein [Salmonella enterica]EFS1408083.1 hypothetical protein [Salmonella enterica]EHQ8162531.1 hypothetical protein [Salmonella enterica]EJZ9218184.1 hypothetical protein [Salmonella enterica]
MLLTLTTILAGLLAVAAWKIRTLRRQLADAEGNRLCMKLAHIELADALAEVRKEVAGIAAGLDVYHGQRCEFFSRLYELFKKLPSYKISDRERNYAVNRTRSGLLKLLETQVPRDASEENKDPIYVSACQLLLSVNALLEEQGAAWDHLGLARMASEEDAENTRLQ